MVFHFLDRLIGHDGDPKYYLKNHSYSQLLELGFNEAEAQQLAWIEDQHNRGAYYGFAFGLGALYFIHPFYLKAAQNLPYLGYQRPLRVALNVATVAMFVELGNYLSNAKTMRGNFWVSQLYSNNNFTLSKEAFLKNFVVLNRKFT